MLTTNLCALDVQGFGAQADKLRVELLDVYGDRHEMQKFEADVQTVVRAIYDGPYPEFGGVRLPEVLNFDDQDNHQADSDSESLLQGSASTAYNLRTLFAAAACAYRKDARQYKANNVHKLVLDKALELRTEGVRGPGEGDEQLTDAEKQRRQEALDQFDLAAGASLLANLNAGP